MSLARAYIHHICQVFANNVPVQLAVLGIILAVLAVAGCGGGNEKPNALTPVAGVDLSNPRAVAAAYEAATFRCGDAGAGVRYDLSFTTSPAGRWPRATYIREERRRGCRPQIPPDLRVSLVTEQFDYAVVEVAPWQPKAAVGWPAQLLLVRVDGAWKVDTYRSETTGTAS